MSSPRTALTEPPSSRLSRRNGAGSFIRGEGATIEDAEIAAFGKWKRQYDCFLSGGHRWGRSLRIPPRGDKTDVETRDGKSFDVLVYTNGGCHCLECGAFGSRVMKPIVELGRWKAPPSFEELEAIAMGSIRPSEWDREDPRKWSRYRRRLELRARLFGIDVPDWRRPEFRERRMSLFEKDPYVEACHDAVVRYYAREYERLRSEKKLDSPLGELLRGITRESFHRAAVKAGLLPADEPAEA